MNGEVVHGLVWPEDPDYLPPGTNCNVVSPGGHYRCGRQESHDGDHAAYVRWVGPGRDFSQVARWPRSEDPA